MVHDGLVHQRYFRWVPRSGYARRIVQAHRLHHATVGREVGVSFGFIFAGDPARLKAELKRQRASGLARLRDGEGSAVSSPIMPPGRGGDDRNSAQLDER